MAPPWPQSPPTAGHRAAYADAQRRPFWWDTLAPRDAHEPLSEIVETDLCIVGGGFTGLWAALYAKQLDPGRDVAVLEATRCGHGASGRNGGFLQASLTHGIANGESRFPDELETLERLGLQNFDALAEDLEHHGIDAEYEATGDLLVALEAHELDELESDAALLRRFGQEAEALDGERGPRRLNSPLVLGGSVRPHRCRAGEPVEAVRRIARGRRRRGGADLRVQPRTHAAQDRDRRIGRDRRRRRPGATGAARHQRVSAAAAGDRALVARCTTTRSSPSRSTPTAGNRSAGAAERASATWPTSSTTTA